jgi:hypothetical protein
MQVAQLEDQLSHLLRLPARWPERQAWVLRTGSRLPEALWAEVA